MGIALIHPGQIARPDGRFIAASAGADFEHHTALIAGIPGQEGHRELLAQGAHGLGEARQLLIGELFHGWIAPVLLEQGPGFAFFLFQLLELLVIEHQGLQAGAFPGDGLQLAGIGSNGWIGKLPFQGFKGAPGCFQTIVQQGEIHQAGDWESFNRPLKNKRPETKQKAGCW